jgi:AraC-like DNA-binding protein/mannose-6-phosphate isomerase-like protein (cupin superfamily)
MELLRIEEFLSGDEFYHIHRADVRTAGKLRETVHGHTFCELFLVEEGKGSHLINGEEHALECQTLCLIRQDDTHAVSSRSGLRLVNVAFPAESFSALCRRYGFQFPSDPAADLRWVLGKIAYSVFKKLLADLVERPNSRIALELFLLQILELIQCLHSADQPSRIPGWVREFYRLLNSEEHMAEGIDALTDRVGFSREHASRQLQRYYGQSPSAVLTGARIRYARRELHMSDTSILNIALACGFSSLSQFYAVFRKSVGMPPAAYRNRRP